MSFLLLPVIYMLFFINTYGRTASVVTAGDYLSRLIGSLLLMLQVLFRAVASPSPSSLLVSSLIFGSLCVSERWDARNFWVTFDKILWFKMSK